MTSLERIRRRFFENSYVFTKHFREKMRDENLDLTDIENALLNGYIHERLTRDERGTRYVVEGPTFDERIIHLVVRLGFGRVLFITIYVIEV